MKKLITMALALTLCMACAVPASAEEYTIGQPDDFLFGRPTSIEQVHTEEEPENTDRSKSVALIPPGFGSPTSYLPGSGEYLTPNLVPGALNGGLVEQIGEVNYPRPVRPPPPARRLKARCSAIRARRTQRAARSTPR